MTESPHLKAEGPEPPGVVDLLGEKHREVLSQVDGAILGLLKPQSMFSTETSSALLVADNRNEYAYYREPMQPDREEIERVRAEVYHIEMELNSQRNKLAQATDKLNHVSNLSSIYKAKLIRSYELIGQLVGFLDSIEWGTHDEWTRSQSLRERAHEYVESFNTIAT